MTSTLPLRPSPWPGVAKGQDPRAKGRVLPNSPKSAPLAGGRFRRPARTREGTPSGARFSGHCQVWRPTGGSREGRDAGYVYGSPPCVTGCGRAGPIRVRRRCRVPALAGGDAPTSPRTWAWGRKASDILRLWGTLGSIFPLYCDEDACHRQEWPRFKTKTSYSMSLAFTFLEFNR